MKREEFLNLLNELVEAEEDLSEDSILEEVAEWDSLAVISFMALFSKTFNSTVNAQYVKSSNKVSDLLDLAKGYYS